ncbi:MAG: hypothetical protein U1E76_19420 [Planctomycetota bacterium]
MDDRAATPWFAADAGAWSQGDLHYLPAALVTFLVEHRRALAVLVVSLPIAALGLHVGRQHRVWLPRLCWALTALLLTVALHCFVDEVFFNFLQAKHLAEDGRYSFVAQANVDGSCEVLYYAVVALLHALGIEAPAAALLLGGACFAATLLLVHRLAWRETMSPVLAWLLTLAAASTASLAGLAGSGWSAPLIGLLSMAIVVLYESRHWRWCFALGALFACVRYDFAFYTLATGATLCAVARASPDRRRDAWLGCALSLLVVAAIVLGWRRYYGHYLPTPIIAKASVLNPSPGFVLGRALELARDLAPALLLWLLGRQSLRARLGQSAIPALLVPGLAHYVLVAAGGGDYLPGNRYHTVLVIAVLAGAIKLAAPALRRWQAPGRASLRDAAGGLVAAAAIVLASGTASKVATGLARPAIEAAGDAALFANGLTGMTQSRINGHLRCGRFFSRLTQGMCAVRLASLEVASVFYAYDGPSLDLLGFANRAVATGSDNPAPRHGLFDKKLDPEVIARERPELIWLDTRVLAARAAPATLRPRAVERVAAMREFLAWSAHHWWTEPYLPAAPLAAGYVCRITLLGADRCVLWLAREDLAPKFDAQLAALGFVRQGRMPE